MEAKKESTEEVKGPSFKGREAAKEIGERITRAIAVKQKALDEKTLIKKDK